MKNRKKTGSYYTPDFLSEFMLKYVCEHFSEDGYLSILEPSIGDGSFLKAFTKTHFPGNIKRFSFTAIDKVKPELQKAEKFAEANRRSNTKYSFTRIDFLKYQHNLKRKFHLVIGNPPYIKKQLLSNVQQNHCQDIYREAGLSNHSVKNIWTAFLVRGSQLLTDDGVLAYVLPADLLQVKFSQELRDFLSINFARTEIFTFDDLLFECKGQDTVILFAFKKHSDPGQYYTHISDTAQLISRDFSLTENSALSATGIKWTHHSLSSEELMFLHGLGQRIRDVDQFCISMPGIVTAANDFFIVNSKVEADYELSEYVRPIIQKGSFVNGSVVFSSKDYRALYKEGKPTRLLAFEDTSSRLLPRIVRQYLALGKKDDLHTRYKCRKRKNWHVVPNVAHAPQGFFFKRSHNYPKLLKNEAKVLVTDSAYKVEMKNEYEIESFVYSFYNSLTLAFAELRGRYYGGGVLELTPSEFKSLPVPYVQIDKTQFSDFVTSFENKTSIDEILKANDFQILNRVLGLTSLEINRVNSIYRKLINKRLRLK